MMSDRTRPSPPAKRPALGVPWLRGAVLVVATVIACSTSFGPAHAQESEVVASVNKRHVAPGETVTYTIVVQADSRPNVQTPRPPGAPELTLLRSTPRSSRNITVINGEIQQRVSFQWTFRANSEGTPRIGSTTVVVDGRAHETDPITLDVAGRRSAQDTDPSAERDIEGLFIEARPSETEVVSGQQITVEYVLFFRDGLHVENSRMAGSWKADGLWREELDVERHPVPDETVVDGVRYHTVTLKRVAVFPTHPGTFRIDPLTIESEVQRRGSGLRPFPFNRLRDNLVVSTEVASPAVTVRSRSLPDGAPPSFQGAVGSYRMSVESDSGPVRAGSAFEIQIRLEGAGNISTLSAPELDLPRAFDVFDPDVEETIDRSGRRLRGSKTFTYPVVAREAGDHRLPSLEFAYFDPDANGYRRLESEPRSIRVTPSADPATAGNQSAATDSISGPLNTASASEGTAPPLYRQTWPYALVGGPALIAAGLFLLLVRRRRRTADELSARADELAEEHLDRADALRRDGRARAFYEEIDRTVRAFLGRRLDLSAGGMSHAALRDHLRRTGIPADVAERLVTLLEECERARFSPTPPGETAMTTATSRAARLLEALDEVWVAPETATDAGSADGQGVA